MQDWATHGDFVFEEKRLPRPRVVPEDLFEGCFLQGQVPFGKNWWAFVGCWTCPSRSCCRKGGFFLCGTSIDNLFTNRGNARKFCILGKNVSPLSCALLSSRGFVLFVSGRSNDWCRGFRWKNVSPISGIHLSILPRLVLVRTF